MAEGRRQETMIESFLRAVENTKSTTELNFENLEVSISSLQTKVNITGKISVVVRPMHE